MGEHNSIPKIIHYCWFGKNPMSEKAEKCIASWKEKCPEYRIIEWNEENFDIQFNNYVREAYSEKKWAFVSDVARLYALVNYGGIYMDTDVEVITSLDILLKNEAFAGFETMKKQIKKDMVRNLLLSQVLVSEDGNIVTYFP